METTLFELTHATENDISRIKTALRLNEGSIDLANVPVRAIENCDLYVTVGYFEYGKRN